MKTRQTAFLALALLMAPGSVGSVKAASPWTLEQCLEHALLHSPDALIARHRIAGARARLEQANSAFWPRVRLESGYTRTDNPMRVFGSILNQRAYRSSLDFNDVPDVDALNLSGVLTVPLYAGGRNVAARRAARAEEEASRLDDEAIRNALGFEVARAFHTVLKTRRFIEAVEAQVRAFEAHRDIARKRLDGGTLLKSDALDIEVRLAGAREDLARARNANSLAERALRHLLGIEEGEFTVSNQAPETRAPDSGDFTQRPELAAAREHTIAAEAQVRGARSGYVPRVSAFSSVDYDYGWVTRGDGTSYSVGILAQWDIWDGFSTRSRAREAEAHLHAAREEQRRLRLALDFEVEQARIEYNEARERLAVSDRTVEQAAESARLTGVRFEQGLALATDLIEAESTLVAARVRRAEAEVDERIAVAAWRKALGWPQLDSKPPTK